MIVTAHNAPCLPHQAISPLTYAKLVQSLLSKGSIKDASDILNIIAYYGDNYAETIFDRNTQVIQDFIVKGV